MGVDKVAYKGYEKEIAELLPEQNEFYRDLEHKPFSATVRDYTPRDAKMANIEVLTGVCRPGMELIFYPSKMKAKVKRIEYHHEDIEEAKPGQVPWIEYELPKGQHRKIRPGLVAEEKYAPTKGSVITAKGIVMNKDLKEGEQYILFAGWIRAIARRIGPSSGRILVTVKSITPQTFAEKHKVDLIIDLHQEIWGWPYKQNPRAGTFILGRFTDRYKAPTLYLLGRVESFSQG